MSLKKLMIPVLLCLTAFFAVLDTASASTPQTYSLITDVAGTGRGTVTVTPPGGTYDAGTEILINASPDTVSIFDHWSGDCSGTTSYYYLTMTGNMSCTANFVPMPAPQVIATDVNPASITAYFNVPMNQSTIDSTTFVVRDQVGNPVAGKFTFAGNSLYNQVMFKPSSVLLAGSTYTVTVTTGVQNLLGMTLEADYSWVFTADLYLGGVAGEGNLLIIPMSDGRIGVYRHISGEWQEQVFNWDNKGSRLQVNGTGYAMGYYNNGTPPAAVANSQPSGTQTKTEWTTADGLRITQELTYLPGSVYYGLRWKIANESSTDRSDLRFFHGEDTYFFGDDHGAGFWDAPNNTIGVQRTIGKDLSRMSLQAVTIPFAYDSEFYYTVISNVDSGALTNTIDPIESTDNGYALEWRNAILPAGATWTISAYEKFADVQVGAVSVTAPVSVTCNTGAICNLTYTVTNSTIFTANITLTLTPDQTGWSASTTSTSLAVAPGSSQVIVQLTIPAEVADGLVGHLALSANDGSTTAGDTAAIRVLNPLVTYSLTTATAGTGTGTISLNTAQGPYLVGTSIQLVATPSAGSSFAGWSGDCNGTINPFSLTIDANKSCTAKFNLTPVITWGNPAAVTYGTPLSATQLNATSGGVAGTFVYTPTSGTVLNAGAAQTLSVIFTPDDSANYNAPPAVTVAITITPAAQATLVVTGLPARASFGQSGIIVGTIGGSSTGAVSFSAGSSRACSVVSTTGAVTITSGSGSCSITAMKAADSNYTAITSGPASTSITSAAQATLVVAGLPASASFGQSGIIAGTTGGSGTGAVSFSAGSSSACSVAPSTGAVTITSGSGSCSITATKAADSNYNASQVTDNLTVAKAVPVITWSNPAAITYGTPLSATQLNVTSVVSGTFTYSPASGAILTAGTQTLSATFTPNATTDYTTQTATASLTVNALPSVDLAAPAVTEFTVPATSATVSVSGTTETAAVPVGVKGTDDFGVTGYLLLESSTPNAPPATPLATDQGWTTVPSTSYTFNNWGNHTLYVYVKDAADHISAPKSSRVYIGTNPDADGVIIPAPDGSPQKLEPTLADAQRSLKFALGIVTPTPTEILHGIVAPLVNGVPTPGDRKQVNLGDTIVILRRVVGLWQTIPVATTKESQP
jgi:hypothetical protein